MGFNDAVCRASSGNIRCNEIKQSCCRAQAARTSYTHHKREYSPTIHLVYSVQVALCTLNSNS